MKSVRREQLVESLATLPPNSAAWVRAHRNLVDFDQASKPDEELITIIWQCALIAIAIIGAAYLGAMWVAR